ncbi:MAG: hypothetical protein FJ100_06195 [Deltaproteobacteria bacterium]|nr:hypothetical protein [Deltaproteobacteria bacterium]
MAHREFQQIRNNRGVVSSADLLKEAGFGPGVETIVLAQRGQVTVTSLDPDFDAAVAAADRFTERHANALQDFSRALRWTRRIWTGRLRRPATLPTPPHAAWY